MQEGRTGKVLLNKIHLALLPEVWRTHHSHRGTGHPQDLVKGGNICLSVQTYRVQDLGRAQGRRWLHRIFCSHGAAGHSAAAISAIAMGAVSTEEGFSLHSEDYSTSFSLKLKNNCVCVYTHVHTYIHRYLLKYVIYRTLNMCVIYNMSNTICIVHVCARVCMCIWQILI